MQTSTQGKQGREGPKTHPVCYRIVTAVLPTLYGRPIELRSKGQPKEVGIP